MDGALDFYLSYRDHGLIEPGFAPHAVYTVREEHLKELKDYSEIFDSIYHVHVSETATENLDCIKENGKTPVQYLEDLGAVNEKLVAAHCVWLEEKDIKILSRNEGTVVHNPSANLKLGSGIADISRLIDRGVNVALGTDGVASNNNMNLFEEAKFASLLHKINDPLSITAQQILDMATVNGARALGLDEDIGSVEVGKKADLITIDLNETSMNPVTGKEDIISHLVYSFHGKISDSIINGDIIVENGEIDNINEKDLMEKSGRSASIIRS